MSKFACVHAVVVNFFFVKTNGRKIDVQFNEIFFFLSCTIASKVTYFQIFGGGHSGLNSEIKFNLPKGVKKINIFGKILSK